MRGRAFRGVAVGPVDVHEPAAGLEAPHHALEEGRRSREVMVDVHEHGEVTGGARQQGSGIVVEDWCDVPHADLRQSPSQHRERRRFGID